VQRVAQRITRAADESFAWDAVLLKADDVPNAFCLPNGRIAIYTGILPITQTEDGLAAVMGHEVAHATMRHGGKRMTQGMLTNAAMAAVDAGLGIAEMDTSTRGTVMSVIGAGAQYGVLLPYSREHETEADVEGIRFAIRAGYDPNAAPALWERMAELGDSGPSFLSTHPNPLDRAAKLREVIPQIVEQEKNWQPKPKAQQQQ
jgi:predicted Zn-dependent protease